MTDDELAAIKARCEAATDGPWIEYHVTSRGKTVGQYVIPGLDTDDSGMCIWDNMRCVDQDFIAFSRTDVPRLLAEVTRLRAALAAESAKVRQQQRELMELRNELMRANGA